MENLKENLLNSLSSLNLANLSNLTNPNPLFSVFFLLLIIFLIWWFFSKKDGSKMSIPLDVQNLKDNIFEFLSNSKLNNQHQHQTQTQQTVYSQRLQTKLPDGLVTGLNMIDSILSPTKSPLKTLETIQKLLPSLQPSQPLLQPLTQPKSKVILPPTLISEKKSEKPKKKKIQYTMPVSGQREFDSRPEALCCSIVEEIYKKAFNKVRPDFLKNPETGSNLELDCYNDELKIAIEYSGSQHYKFPNYFHKTNEDFIKQVRRDQFKAQVCDLNGIYLITVPYWVPEHKLKEFIIEHLPEQV